MLHLLCTQWFFLVQTSQELFSVQQIFKLSGTDLNFYFRHYESNNTYIHLNANASAYYFNVGLHSGNKMWMQISVL